MSTHTKKLRLGPLPSSTSTKLTFTCPASLKADLDHYAALHAHAGSVHGWRSGIQEEGRIKADVAEVTPARSNASVGKVTAKHP
jgi:hypothetical protein